MKENQREDPLFVVRRKLRHWSDEKYYQNVWWMIEDGDDPFLKYPTGAEWVERMRMAGYEPTLGAYSERAGVYIESRKDFSGVKDKEVYKAMADDLKKKEILDDVRNYLLATEAQFRARSHQPPKKKKKSLLSGKKRKPKGVRKVKPNPPTESLF